MFKKYGLYLFFAIILLTQTGCVSNGLMDGKRIDLSDKNISKCKELKRHVGIANHRVKIVEYQAKERLGDRFNHTERSLAKHPDLLNTYSISLDNLAQAVQNYKSQSCS